MRRSFFLPTSFLALSSLHSTIYAYILLSEALFTFSKAGVTNSFDGHKGPVTGIDTHKVQGAVDFSHLYLTSSFDWTLKLWSTRVCTHPPSTASEVISPGSRWFGSNSPMYNAVATHCSRKHSMLRSANSAASIVETQSVLIGFVDCMLEATRVRCLRTMDMCTKAISNVCIVILQLEHPLYTFKDSTEYVMDVSWSPIHPALFASVDGNGKFSLWNLNNDTEVAIVIEGRFLCIMFRMISEASTALDSICTITQREVFGIAPCTAAPNF